MKQVLTLSESAEVELLKNVLEKCGIHCVLKNAQIAQAIPITPFHAELWVLNDDDLPAAQALCHDWFAPEPEALDGWACSRCGQPLGSRFDACWKCGTKRKMGDQLARNAIVL